MPHANIFYSAYIASQILIHLLIHVHLLICVVSISGPICDHLPKILFYRFQ